MRFESTVVIKDDPEIIFAFITNPRIRKHWYKTLQDSTFEYDNLMLGNSASVFFEETLNENNELKKYTAELIKFEPEENFCFRYLSNKYTINFDYWLTKTLTGTEVKLNTSVAYKSVFDELLTKLKLLGFRKQLTTHLMELKQFCESN